MLKLWLPLDKDTRNQGLYFCDIVNNGATFASEGPVGGCYKFSPEASSAGTNYITLSATTGEFLTGGGSFTIAAFVKLTGNFYSNGAGVMCANVYRNNGIGMLINSSRKIKAQICYGSTETEWNGSAQIPQNEWHHIALTYDSETMQLTSYLDGVKDAATTLTSQWTNHPTSKVLIGKGTQGGWQYTLPGYMYDIRVYDNALRLDEIRDLALNKVFDVSEKSFLEGTKGNLMAATNLEKTNGWTSYGFGGRGVPQLYTEESGPSYGNVVRITGKITSADTSYEAEIARGVPIKSMKSGDTYTFSIYAKMLSGAPISQMRLWCYVGSASGALSTGQFFYNISDEWQRFSYTFPWKKSAPSYTSMSTYIVPKLNRTQALLVSNFQLESGSTPTPYSFSTGTTPWMFDKSGVPKEGQEMVGIVNSGETLYFDGVSSYYKFNINFARSFDSAYTFSFWVNSQEADSSRSIYFGAKNDGTGWTLAFEKQANTNAFRVYNAGKPDWYVANCVMTPNTWIHVGVAFSGGTCNVYKNGVLVGTKTGFTAHSLFDTTYYLGSDARSGDTRYKGYLAKFKIYATCMTADDILRIYNKEKNKFM